jgi:hypothetical protein
MRSRDPENRGTKLALKREQKTTQGLIPPETRITGETAVQGVRQERRYILAALDQSREECAHWRGQIPRMRVGVTRC